MVVYKKALNSVVANAENNHGADVDELKVSTIYITEGPRLKRTDSSAEGRSDRIIKRSCHITVKVSDNQEGKK